MVERFWAAQSHLLASNPHLADLQAAPATADGLAEAPEVHYHSNRPIEEFFRFDADDDDDDVDDKPQNPDPADTGDYIWEKEREKSVQIDEKERESLQVSGVLNAAARVKGSQDPKTLNFTVRSHWPRQSIYQHGVGVVGAAEESTSDADDISIVASTRRMLEKNVPLQPLFDYIDVDDAWRGRFGVDKTFFPEPWQLRMLEAISEQKSMLVNNLHLVAGD